MSAFIPWDEVIVDKLMHLLITFMMLVTETILRERIEYSNGAFETVFGTAYAYESIFETNRVQYRATT